MNILLDCERMKFMHTGLYYFCLQLGRALQEQVKEDQLYFYTPAAALNIFGDAQYLQQHSLQKFFFPSVKKLDVWHCTFQGSNYFPSGRKIKKVLTIHDINFMQDENIPPVKKKKYISELAHKIQQSDHIAAISRYTLDEVKRAIGIGDKPASVIYNGCNIDPAITISAPVYRPGKPFLLNVGTIAEKKNMHVLPALLHNNDFELIIAGITISESYKQKIIAEAIRWNVKERVIFTGPVSENDKYWYLQHCEAFVFPSLAEGFGLPVVEAMYFGKPLLLSSLSSLPEIGGKLAYYFNNFEPLYMQQVLISSLNHYHLTQPAAALKKRSQLFSWKTAAQQYLNIYHSVKD